jgi:hypothetical protein
MLHLHLIYRHLLRPFSGPFLGQMFWDCFLFFEPACAQLGRMRRESLMEQEAAEAAEQAAAEQAALHARVCVRMCVRA